MPGENFCPPKTSADQIDALETASTSVQGSFVFDKSRLLTLARGLDQKALLRIAQHQRATPLNRGEQIGDALVIFAASVVPVNFRGGHGCGSNWPVRANVGMRTHRKCLIKV